jgi:nicotinamidase-related amidase
MKLIRPALLIIDMQNDVVLDNGPLRVAQARTIVPNILSLLNEFRAGKLPIFHLLRVHRADGSDVEFFRSDLFRKQPFLVDGTSGVAVIDELSPVKGEYVIPRVRMSAFMGTDLDLRLRSLGMTDLVLTGVQTPNCIRATATDGMALNYPVTVIKDAVGAQNDEVNTVNLQDMANIGVRITKAEELIAALPQSTGES